MMSKEDKSYGESRWVGAGARTKEQKMETRTSPWGRRRRWKGEHGNVDGADGRRILFPWVEGQDAITEPMRA